MISVVISWKEHKLIQCTYLQSIVHRRRSESLGLFASRTLALSHVTQIGIDELCMYRVHVQSKADSYVGFIRSIIAS